jgi:hypothetical protein
MDLLTGSDYLRANRTLLHTFIRLHLDWSIGLDGSLSRASSDKLHPQYCFLR